MFNDEENENYFEGDLTKDLESFESYLKGGTIGYYDVDRLEAMVDHYLISGQYKKGKKHGIWKYYENGDLINEKDFTYKPKYIKKKQ